MLPASQIRALEDHIVNHTEYLHTMLLSSKLPNMLLPIIDRQKHFMCDAVLKFTVSQNISHLSVLSREQMKKEVRCLLPITVAPDATQKEGKHLL